MLGFGWKVRYIHAMQSKDVLHDVRDGLGAGRAAKLGSPFIVSYHHSCSTKNSSFSLQMRNDLILRLSFQSEHLGSSSIFFSSFFLNRSVQYANHRIVIRVFYAKALVLVNEFDVFKVQSSVYDFEIFSLFFQCLDLGLSFFFSRCLGRRTFRAV